MAIYSIAGISGLFTFLLAARLVAPRPLPRLKHSLLALSVRRSKPTARHGW